MYIHNKTEKSNLYRMEFFMYLQGDLFKANYSRIIQKFELI